MTEKLNITTVQSTIHWENIDANLNHFDKLLSNLNLKTDVIILPEMFSTGFSMNTLLAEPMEGKAFHWMREKAQTFKISICGSIMVVENGFFYNRFVWMNNDGSYHLYDKRHCFRMANEHKYFTSGNKKIVFDFKGFRICPMVCYDLRFPVWSRNRYVNGELEYDVLLYVANWPERREHAWQSLLVARAIENLSYVIGVNRVGNDGNDIAYSGHTAVYNMLGDKISATHSAKECFETVSLDLSQLVNFRKQFPAYLDADLFELK